MSFFENIRTSLKQYNNSYGDELFVQRLTKHIVDRSRFYGFGQLENYGIEIDLFNLPQSMNISYGFEEVSRNIKEFSSAVTATALSVIQGYGLHGRKLEQIMIRGIRYGAAQYTEP